MNYEKPKVLAKARKSELALAKNPWGKFCDGVANHVVLGICAIAK